MTTQRQLFVVYSCLVDSRFLVSANIFCVKIGIGSYSAAVDTCRLRHVCVRCSTSQVHFIAVSFSNIVSKSFTVRGMNSVKLWALLSKPLQLSAVEPFGGDQQHEVLSAAD